MKTSAILVGVGAALAVAQDISFPQGFPDCGVTCIRNMLGQAAQLGCSDVAPSCLCTKQNFIYGVRDCATESCPDNASAQQVIQYGSQYCASVGVAVSGLPSATGQNPSASTTVVATASPTTASASQESGRKTFPATPVINSYSVACFSTIYTNSQTTDATGSGSIPISTATFETTVTHSGSAIASTVTSTAFSASGVSASGTGVSGNVSGSVTTGVVASSITTNGSTLVTSVTTTGPASSHASEASSEASGTGSSTHAGSESTSSSSNPAQRTAAPAGFIAAAGLAALML
ncbi:hypothetical protein K449DRAFT_402096 [Hypoxylon sp. EC38]|nr:hypothetical protein K449DRAFT_402096 [Hypoxylon sp. EC38]